MSTKDIQKKLDDLSFDEKRQLDYLLKTYFLIEDYKIKNGIIYHYGKKNVWGRKKLINTLIFTDVLLINISYNITKSVLLGFPTFAAVSEFHFKFFNWLKYQKVDSYITWLYVTCKNYEYLMGREEPVEDYEIEEDDDIYDILKEKCKNWSFGLSVKDNYIELGNGDDEEVTARVALHILYDPLITEIDEVHVELIKG